jgi:surface polysaccharide O-acyltransferase-like enzyme
MKRLVYLDWLRVFATIAVVTIHVAAGAGSIGEMQPGESLNWLESNLFETLSRWSVPGFIMISGALLLQSQKITSLGVFLKKRLSKVVIPLVGWSILFYLYGCYKGYFIFSLNSGVKLFITNGISDHLWFLYMIIGIYLITPLLQIFVKHATKKHIQYFLLLWLYSSVVTRLSNFWLGFHLSIELFYVTDYVGYFLLGYYLNQYEIPKRWRILSYIGASIGFIGTFFGTYYYTLKGKGILNDYWYGYFSPTVLLSAIGLFLWFQYHFKEVERPLPRMFQWVNSASLGVYILHYWLMNNFLWMVFPEVKTYFHPLISLPINLGITVFISTVLSMILKKIPLVKKLIP